MNSHRLAVAVAICAAGLSGTGCGIGPEATAADDQADQSAALEVRGCPVLAGTYACPARGSQPAYTLKVTEKRAGAGKQYSSAYSFLGPDPAVVFVATPAGNLLDFGYVAQCVRYLERGAVVLYPQGQDPATSGTYNFIDENGDWRADFGGVTQIVCTDTRRR